MEILDNQKRLFSILGLIFVFLALVSYLLLFYELLTFELRPWPYDSGASWQRVVLYESVFLVQWIAHCKYLDLSALGYLVWKYWGSLFGVGLGFLLQVHAESKERYPLFDLLQPRLSLLGVSGVFLASCVLYLCFALDFQEGAYYPLLDFSLIFVYPLFYPVFVLVFLPPLVFYVAHRAVSSKSFLIAFPFLIILDIFLTFIIYAFSHSCI